MNSLPIRDKNMVKSPSFDLAIGFRLPISDWLPGETLFSLCARHHRLYGHMLSSATCHTLFGHAWQGTQHDLPGRISEFIARSEGYFGDCPEKLALLHTLIGFYLPWRSLAQQQQALQAMSSGGIGALKMHLGLPASRVRANHPLKFCPACFTQDREIHAVAYWHLAHQYPGVWTCIEHGCGLFESNVKATGVGRFLWHLPKLKDTYPLFQGESLGPDSMKTLRALTQLVCHASTQPLGTTIDFIRLYRAYRQMLRTQGLISDSSRPALAEICGRLQACTSHFRFIEELGPLHQSQAAVQAQVRRLLKGPRPGTHPLRHLLFILVVFGDWETFVAGYRDIGDAKPDFNSHSHLMNEAQPMPRRSATKRARLIQLMQQQGFSATRAADAIGVDRSTGIVWATEHGLKTSVRSQRPPAIRRRMIRELERGVDVAAVAEKHEVSNQVVMRLLRSTIGLRKAWREVRLDRARKYARATWQSARRRNPKLGVKAIRAMERGAYAWLYRNDRQWLDAHKMALTPEVRRKRRLVDWASRDEKFVSEAWAAVLALRELAPRQRLTVQALYQRIPSLKAKLWAIEMMPRTKRLLESIQARRKRNPAKQLNLPLY